MICNWKSSTTLG